MKTKVKQIQKNKNLIEGNFFKNIIVFSLPLILSNVLQVLFNMADIAIVGQFDPNGKYLVGAIGSTSMLISLVYRFFDRYRRRNQCGHCQRYRKAGCGRYTKGRAFGIFDFRYCRFCHSGDRGTVRKSRSHVAQDEERIAR